MSSKTRGCRCRILLGGSIFVQLVQYHLFFKQYTWYTQKKKTCAETLRITLESRLVGQYWCVDFTLSTRGVMSNAE